MQTRCSIGENGVEGTFVWSKLGDQLNFQILQKLRVKNISRVSEQFLKSFWLRRVLEDIRKSLSMSKIMDLSLLAEVADKLCNY